MSTLGYDDLSYYLLVSSKLEILLCNFHDFYSYDFSGRRLFGIIDYSSHSNFLDAIYQAISEYKPRLLLVSIDPFILKPQHEILLQEINLPIGAIICDTHHGTRPISRILELCIKANIRSVLLQFNHRHHIFFEKLGIPVSCSFFSPDLYSFIASASSPFLKKSDEGKVYFAKRTECESGGVFIGSASNVHRYRRLLLEKINLMGLRLDICRTPDPLSMIRLMSGYSWSLNLPLNGDFNRRFVESFMSFTGVISEFIPSSQFFFPILSLRTQFYSLKIHWKCQTS